MNSCLVSLLIIINLVVCFSKNIVINDREALVALLGLAQTSNFGKYLGLPSFVGKNKRLVFSYIEDKIKQRIGS